VMVLRQIVEHTRCFRSESQKDLSAICAFAISANVSGDRQAVYEFNRAVVLHPQTFGNLADSGTYSGWQSPDGKEHLVLPGFQT